MDKQSAATAKALRRKKWHSLKLFLYLAPFMACVLIFFYYPLYGWIYAFYDFRPPARLFDTNFVGFQWFTTLFNTPARRSILFQVMTNTLAMSGIFLGTSWLPMVFAVFLTEMKNRRVRKSIQTLTTLPNFVSWVLVYSIAFSMFGVHGIVNNLLQDAGLIDLPINFLASSNNVWLTMWLWGTWKGLGWGAILYLAAISGIDQEMYEAAQVDGAGRMQMIWHITIPSLLPTYFVLLLLSVGNLINNGMEPYFYFQNAFNMHRIQVLDLYIYNVGLAGGSYSFATAVGMMKSLISVTLLFSINRLSKVIRGHSIF